MNHSTTNYLSLAKCALCILAIFCFTINVNAQNRFTRSYIDYTQSFEGGVGGDCWESGDEEYTVNARIWNDESGWCNSYNRQATANGTGTNNTDACDRTTSAGHDAAQLYSWVEGWEDDTGNRSTYESSNDDCYGVLQCGPYNITDYAINTWRTDVCTVGGDHSVAMRWYWNYVAVNQPSAFSFTSVGCDNNRLNAISSNQANVTWYWQGTNSNGTSTANVSTSNYSISSPGTYYLRARGNRNGAWSSSRSLTINASQLRITPAAVSVSGGGNYCPGTPVTITASGGSGGTIYFQGTTSNGTSTSNASSSQTITSAGTYYFRSADTSPGGPICWGAQGSVTVTYNDNVNPTITCPSNVTTTTNSGCTATGVNLGTPSTSDNCSVASVTNDAPSAFPLGTTTVTWTVTDGSGNTATCTQTVTVSDDDNPTITCPSNVTATTNSGCTATGVNLGTPSTSDNCSVASVTNDAPSAFPLGTTTVTWTVTDGSGNTATCTQTVTVSDDDNPTITCPSDVTATTNSGCTATGVNLGTPSTSDNCSVASVTNDAPSAFPLGTTTVTWTVTDGSGNIATCTQTVTVSDDDNPIITCPSDVTASTNSGCTATGVNLGTPSTSDNCSVASVTNDAPSAFPLGTTTVTWTVTDGSGNTATCTQTVTVTDDTNPTAICQDITVQLDASGNASITTADIDNGSNDACGIASLSLDVTSFDCSNVGANPVVLTVTDNNGNVSTCSATVTVEDNVAPTALCQDITVQLDASGNASITTADIDNGSNDACGIASISLDVTSFDCSNVGANPVVLTVTDNNGNVSTCSATVTIEDNIAPTIVGGCPSDITTTNSLLNCNQLVSWDHPTTEDNCGIQSTVFTSPGVVITDVGAGTVFGLFSVGTSEVTYTVTDVNGNISTCTFNITVEDVEAPVITGCPADIIIGTDVGACNAQVFWTPPTASDNCPGVTMTVNGHFSGQTYPIGTTIVEYTATDNIGLQTVCTFDIIISDNEAPELNCPSDITQNTDAGSCDAVVTFSVTGSDNCPGETLVQTAGLPSGSTFPLGTTTNTFEITDAAGNTTTCSFDVIIVDNEAPIAVCQNITIELDSNGVASIRESDIENGSSDACGIASYSLDITDFDCSNIGDNTVVLTVTDNNGNSTTCSAIVTVEDNIAPTPMCQDITIQLDGTGQYTLTPAEIDAGSADACGIASLSISQSNFDCSHIGANTVTLYATDNNGNLDSCTAVVSVEDNIAPVALCQNITIQLDASGAASITVADVDAGSSDECGLEAISLSQFDFDCSHVGANTVTLTAMDNNSNVSTCDAIVTVEDNVAPVALCQDITVQLDATGNASIVATDIDGGSSDACGIASLAVDVSSFDCSDVGANTVVLTVTDNNGNSSTCNATVTVEDNVAPTALCQNITVQLDASGNASITTADIDNGSNDACGIASLAVDVSNFDCSNVGDNTVVLTVTDNNGNSSTCTAIVTVEDDIAPVALCQDITVQLDASGNASIIAADVDGGSSDACGIANLSIDKSNFTCADISSAPTVSNDLFISEYIEGSGNNKCIEIYNGTGADINLGTNNYNILIYFNGSSSAGSSINLSGTINDGDVFVICNSSASSSFTSQADLTNGGVTFNGDDAVVLRKNTTILDVIGSVGQDPGSYWNVGGNRTQNRTLVRNDNISDGNSSGTSGFPSLGTEWTEFPENSVVNLGTHTVATVSAAQQVTLTVTDNNGNTSTCVANVTVEDNIAPTALCQNIKILLDANGEASISTADIDNGSNDACGIESLSLDVTEFDCSDVGDNTVVLTVTDVNGNVSTCSANVEVEDKEAPIALCQNITVQLDASGNVSIDADDIDNGSNDACGIANLSLDVTSFDCSNIGANTVVLTVTDNNGNVSTCSATVTVEDNVAPIALCQDITVQLDASGNATIVAADVDGGSSDACGIASISIDDYAFDCSDISAAPAINELFISEYIEGGGNNKCIEIFNGTTSAVDLSADDYRIKVYFNGSSSASSNIALSGVIAPGDVYVICNASATSTFTALANQTSSNLSFNGDDAVELTKGGTSIDIFGKIGQDPGSYWSVGGIRTQNRTLVRTVASGNIDNLSGFPSLGIEWAEFSQDDASNLGSHSAGGAGVPVTLTVTDVNGNSSSCVATVTVEDNVAPVALCQDITVQLDASGNASIVAADVDGGSNDACGIESLDVDVSDFDCSNVGANTVELTVTDNNGNSSTCTATVTVEDNIAPTAVCQDITIQLAPDGTASISASDIDNGSNDACGIASLDLDITSFDCSNVGANTVVLTVTDNNGNTSICSATVTVEDNTNPIALCQDITVQLDASGNASITTADIDNGSNDACGTANLSLDVSNFDCSNVGDNTVVLSVTDNNGNTSTCTSTVAVEDNVAPVALCQNITVQLDASGNASITTADIDNGSNDACGIASLSLDVTTFDCSNVGANTVVLTVTDNNGNVSTCSATVTVEDNIAPTALCQAAVIQLDASGSATITPDDIDFGSNDACGIASLSVSQSNFDCTHIGDNTVTLTVTDNNGNVSTCTAVVTVEDNVAPVALCQDITIQLDAFGNAAITAADIDGGSSDACGIASLNVDVSNFDCSNVGANTVELTVTDNNGNVSTCAATVTIEDNIAPQALCQDITIQLDALGNASITTADIDNGSNDACGIASLSLDQTTFDCSNVGSNTVRLTVTDNNGNVSLCTATVTVEDNVAPVALCQNITVELDINGNAVITPGDIDNGSNDACGIASLSLDKSSFDCSEVGANTVELTVTDNNGNVSTCTATVTVEDNIAPTALCQDITIQLDEFGNASIVPEDINNGSSDNCAGGTSVSNSLPWINEIICTDLTIMKEFSFEVIYDGSLDLDAYTVKLYKGSMAGTTVNEYASYTLTQLDVSSSSIGNGLKIASSMMIGAVSGSDVPLAVGIFNGSTLIELVSWKGQDPSTVITNTGFTSNHDVVFAEGITVSGGFDIVAERCGNIPPAITNWATQYNPHSSPISTTNSLGSVNSCQTLTSSSSSAGLTLTLNQTEFDCSHVGENTVTLTVTDVNGNSSTCTSTVVVEDNVAPVALCQDITVQLDAFGNAAIVPADIDNGSNDACGIASLSLDNTEFTCSNVGANIVELTVTDNNGNQSTCSATVTIEDNVAPDAVCQDITIQLDATGAVSITAADVDGGSSDACGIADLSIDVASFDCSNVGANTVVLTVTDVNGNSSTCTANITVEDNVAPEAVCQDITVQLDASGNATIVAADVDGGSTDACGVASLSIDRSSFTCADIQTSAVASNDLFISEYIEGGGNNKCIEIYNGTGTAINLGAENYNILIYFNGSTSAGSSINLSGTINDGDTYVICNSNATSTFTSVADVTSGGLNFNGDDAVVLRKSTTILDVIGSVGQDPGSYWSAGGNRTQNRTLVRNDNVSDGNSSGASGFPSLGTEWTEFAQDYSSNLGSHTVAPAAAAQQVTLTVTDVNGNSSTCVANVTVEDNVAPEALCQGVTVQLDASGNASITTADIDAGSNDACGIESLSLDITEFDCSDVGENTVVLTVTDVNGNVSTCSATVIVEDNVAPVALCQNITVQLDALGNVTIDADDIDDGSNDACGIASLSLDETEFTCSNVGDNTVVLTVTDNNGNVSTCSATVTVEDNVAPEAICQDITVQLDASGNATIVAADVDGGSNDACGIASLSIDDNAFDCSDISVTPTIDELFISEYIEGSGNNKCIEIYNGTASPVDLSAGDYRLKIYFNGSGSASSNIALSGVVASGDVYVICNSSATSTFTSLADETSGSLSYNGDDVVELTKGGTSIDIFGKIGQDPGSAWNAGGNVAQNRTLVRTSDVLTGNTDNATNFPALGTEWTEFPQDDASNLGSHSAGGGGVPVTLTVTDVNGNTSTCVANVTVEDNIAPEALCQNITVQLDALGNASITTADIDAGSNDACGIESLSLDVTTFDCSNIGDNTVVLTVTDVNGNVSTCSATVTVEDNVAPVALCQSITVQLDASGVASITPSDIDDGSSDACGIASLDLDVTSFDCSNVGDNTVVLTVTDNNGNVSTCSATVTVEDNVAPVALCQNITVQLDASGLATIIPSDIDDGSNDACGIAGLALDVTSFDCSNVGDNTVVLTVTDNNGNVSTCSATVTVEDNVAPVALCQNVTVQLDAAGNASISTGDIDNGSNDACGIAILALDVTTFDCSNVGDNTVVLTVTDVNGNVSTCSATVTVEDNVAPVALCQNITVQLDANGVATVTPSEIDNGSNDACGIASLDLDVTSFDCSNVGVNPVVLTVTDNNGNATSCNATVTIEDNVAPEALCQSISVQLDAAGNASITTADIDNGSNDACGIASLSLDVTTFDCSNVGANPVVLTVTDNNGNVSTCTAEVTVEDNIDPIALCQDVTVTLDALGNASITAADVDNGSNDACGIADLFLSQTSFTYTDYPSTVVTLLVTDNNGNTATCNSTVTVIVPCDNVTDGGEIGHLEVGCGPFDPAEIVSVQDPSGGGNAPIEYVWLMTNDPTTPMSSWTVIAGANGSTYDPALISETTYFRRCARRLGCTDYIAESNLVAKIVNGNGNDCDAGEVATEVSGNADTYVKNHGVHHASNILGPIDGNGADFYHYHDYIIVDLGDVIKAGDQYTITWKKRDYYTYAPAQMLIYESTNGYGWGNYDYNTTVYTTSKNEWIHTTITANVNTRYVKIRNYKWFADFEVDAVTYCNVVCGDLPPDGYCASGGDDSSNDWIEAVYFNDISNVSGNDDGYANFTDISTDLDKGSNYNITLDAGGSDKVYWKVWIDWNQDGDFDDNDETVVWESGYGNEYGNVHVPSHALNGETIMRVAMKRSGNCGSHYRCNHNYCHNGSCYHSSCYPTSCENFAEGEVEDYTVNVVANYCQSYGTNTYYEYINHVSIGDINNVSGNDGGYGDYVGLSTNVSQGSTYTLNLAPGFTGWSYKEYWTVYVDWNGDMDFNDPGEKVGQKRGYGAVSIDIDVPVGATLGNTRMRVQMQYDDYLPSSCSVFYYGEVEDYTLNITDGSISRSNVVSSAPAEVGKETDYGYDINLYPNPTTDYLRIDIPMLSNKNTEIAVVDINGTLLYHFEYGKLDRINTEIDVRNWPSGTYYMTIVNGDRKRTMPFVKIK